MRILTRSNEYHAGEGEDDDGDVWVTQWSYHISEGYVWRLGARIDPVVPWLPRGGLYLEITDYRKSGVPRSLYSHLHMSVRTFDSTVDEFLVLPSMQRLLPRSWDRYLLQALQHGIIRPTRMPPDLKYLLTQARPDPREVACMVLKEMCYGGPV